MGNRSLKGVMMKKGMYLWVLSVVIAAGGYFVTAKGLQGVYGSVNGIGIMLGNLTFGLELYIIAAFIFAVTDYIWIFRMGSDKRLSEEIPVMKWLVAAWIVSLIASAGLVWYALFLWGMITEFAMILAFIYLLLRGGVVGYLIVKGIDAFSDEPIVNKPRYRYER